VLHGNDGTVDARELADLSRPLAGAIHGDFAGDAAAAVSTR